MFCMCNGEVVGWIRTGVIKGTSFEFVTQETTSWNTNTVNTVSVHLKVDQVEFRSSIMNDLELGSRYQGMRTEFHKGDFISMAEAGLFGDVMRVLADEPEQVTGHVYQTSDFSGSVAAIQALVLSLTPEQHEIVFDMDNFLAVDQGSYQKGEIKSQEMFRWYKGPLGGSVSVASKRYIADGSITASGLTIRELNLSGAASSLAKDRLAEDKARERFLDMMNEPNTLLQSMPFKTASEKKMVVESTPQTEERWFSKLFGIQILKPGRILGDDIA